MEPTSISSHFQQDPVPDQSHVGLPREIEYLSHYRLLICRVHTVCLTRNDLLEHLEQEHSMSKEQSSLAFQAALEFDVVITRSGIETPSELPPPVPGLPLKLGYMYTANDDCFFSPHKDVLDIHFAMYGSRHKHSSYYHNVVMQNLFPGQRPLYFMVSTSVNLQSSTNWAAVEGGKTTLEGTSIEFDSEDGLVSDDINSIDGQNSSETSEDVDMEDGFIQQNVHASFSREYADVQNSPSARRGSGSKTSLESAPSALPSLSSAPNLPLDAVNSQSTSQLALASTPPPLLSKNTVFITKRQDTGKYHICLASDIISPGSQAAVLDPGCLNFRNYCALLAFEGVLDRKSNINLGFQTISGERIPISNQMMFRAAVTYQVDRKFDMMTFSAAVAVST